MKFRTLGQLAVDLINRGRFGNVAGVTFGGKRDLYRAFGYARKLFPPDYRSRYLRNAVAARVVEAKPEDTWRGTPEIVEDADVTELTAFEEAFIDLDERIDVWATFEQADILAGIGNYAVIVMLAPGEVDQPLVRCAPQDLYGLRAFAQEDAPVANLDRNDKSPRYGMPEYYTIARSLSKTTAEGGSVTLAKKVHWTRVIHVADGLLDDVVYGTPRLERVWNLCDDLEKVTGGGAEAYYRRADPGTQFDIDPTVELSEDAEEELEEEVDKYVHEGKRVLRTRGMKINQLSSSVSGFKDPQSAIIDQISAGTGIPQRILTGSEQGKLAADQDSTNWDKRIESRRTKWAGPKLVRPSINRWIALGVLPTPDKKWFVEWSQIRTQSDDDKANIATKWANLNQATGKDVVTINEIRTKCLGLEEIEESDLETSQVEPLVEPKPKAASRKESSYRHIHRVADRFRKAREARRLERILGRT